MWCSSLLASFYNPMSNTHIFMIIGAVLALAALGLIGYARVWAERSRQELKKIDKSKLREWDDEDD